MKNLTCIIIAIVLFASNSFSQDFADATLRIDDPAYSIDYPADWRADESGEYGTEFIIYSPNDGVDDQFSENINFMIQDLTGYNMSFEGYIEISLEQIENMMENSRLILSETKTAHGRRYHKVVYTSTQQNFDLKFEQYFWVIGTNAYLLTFTCETSKFEAYQELAEKAMNSFVLK